MQGTCKFGLLNVVLNLYLASNALKRIHHISFRLEIELTLIHNEKKPKESTGSGWPIVYVGGLHVIIFKKYCISLMFLFANSVDPDETPQPEFALLVLCGLLKIDLTRICAIGWCFICDCDIS